MAIPSPSDNEPQSVSGEFPPDPLLDSGAFIFSSTPVGEGTLVSGVKRRQNQGENGASCSGESIRIRMSNGTEQVNPSPDATPIQAETKSRKRAPVGDNWLPPGWRIEDKVRTSGATAGTVDKYYYEPVTGRKFRSRTEVLYYLEHGTSKKSNKKAGNTDDHIDGQGSNRASKKNKQSPPPPPPAPLNFDFENPPEKVTWCMGDAGEEDWTPFIGDEMVEESVRRDWSTAFTVITTQNPSKLSF